MRRPRIYTRRVRETLGRFPAAAILGSRQSGKTTLSRLHKTADLIDATRRVLVCRIQRKIENPTLLVTDLAGWLKRLLA